MFKGLLEIFELVQENLDDKESLISIYKSSSDYIYLRITSFKVIETFNTEIKIADLKNKVPIIKSYDDIIHTCKRFNKNLKHVQTITKA